MNNSTSTHHKKNRNVWCVQSLHTSITELLCICYGSNRCKNYKWITMHENLGLKYRVLHTAAMAACGGYTDSRTWGSMSHNFRSVCLFVVVFIKKYIYIVYWQAQFQKTKMYIWLEAEAGEHTQTHTLRNQTLTSSHFHTSFTTWSTHVVHVQPNYVSLCGHNILTQPRKLTSWQIFFFL